MRAIICIHNIIKCEPCREERARAADKKAREKLKVDPVRLARKRLQDQQGGKVRYAKNAEHILAKGKKYYIENPEKAGRRRQMRFPPGVTVASLLKKQGGCCRVCAVDITAKPYVDHDHKTGWVRGLLCRRCNLGIGQLRDNPETLLQAMLYLLEPSCAPPE